MRRNPALASKTSVRIACAMGMLLGTSEAPGQEIEFSASEPFDYPLQVDLDDRGRITAATEEYDENPPHNLTGKFYLIRSTGVVLEVAGKPTNQDTWTLVTTPAGFQEIPSFFPYGTIANRNGDVLIQFRRVGVLMPETPIEEFGSALWSEGMMGAKQGGDRFLGVDLNDEKLVVGSHLVTFNLPSGSVEDTKDLELPAYLDGLGNPVTINPPTGDSWGYERMSGGPEKWDFGKAVAVNNSGQILCQAQILRPDDPMGIVWDYYSFIYKDGVSGPLKLPGWATDINDLGEVVGGFPGGNETWLYLPSENYGLPAGLHTIPFTRETNQVTEVRPKIGNKGMIVWTGENIGVRQVWVAGTVYPFADLFPDENFEVHDALDLNNAHQFVAETLEDDPQFGTYPSWRIISVPTSITVNTTSDLSDANPADGVVDVDLGTPGNQVSLRAAIDEVLGGRVSEIKFKIPGSGVPRIVLNSELPPITRGVTIDGTTQPGARMVEIQGNPTLDTGLILAASSCAVRGMSINGFTKKNSICLKLAGEGGAEITGNRLGVTPDGNTAKNDYFALVIDGSADNLIGGPDPASANIIVGKFASIQIKGTGANDNRIQGNRIGMLANGNRFDDGIGVHVNNGNGNLIGGEGNLGNRIANLGGITVSPPEGVDMDGVTIQNNRIGLSDQGAAGTEHFGITVGSSTEHPVKNVAIIGNQIGGCPAGILVVEAEGTSIKDNRVGLAFDHQDAFPTGTDPEKQLFGVRIDQSKDTVIEGNTIAGFRFNVLIAGETAIEGDSGEDPDDPSDDRVLFYYPTDIAGNSTPGHVESEGYTVKDNIIGLAGDLPPLNAKQAAGLSVYANAGKVSITGNTVAGNSDFDIWIQTGKEFTITDNIVGLATEVEEPTIKGILLSNVVDATIGGINKGNTIGHHSEEGILILGAALRTKIIGNRIGTNPAGGAPRPNAIGIALFPVDDDVAAETEISDNIIASSTVVGIYLNGANPTVVRDNRIGIGSGGTHLPNRIGLKIENTKTSVIHNTIAYNTFLGVEIAESNSEDTPVLMESNSIFNNGDAGTNEDRGIFYTSPPTVNRLVVATKFDPVTGRETHFFAVPAYELATDVTIEVFANSNLTNPQGETPLFRLPMTDGEDFFHRLDIDSGSELAGSSGFRATATYGGVSTSQFFPVTKQFGFEEPELTFLPSALGFVKLGWPSDPNFKLQTKEKLNQSWVDVAEPVVTQGELDTVTVPLSDAESVFFQLSIDVEAMLSE